MVSSRENGFAGGRSAGSLLSTGPAARTSLGDVVAERLREAILNGELPQGQHLREEQISESLDVSRGPVRDAFIILEREGLVTLSRHRGAAVAQLSVEEFGEVYSLRSAIEQLAVRLAIRRRDESDSQALEQALADLTSGMKRKITEQAAARLDIDFHDCIFRAAHHERLYRSWLSIRMQVHWFLLLRTIASQDWRESMINGHSRIIELIRAGDEDVAVSAISEHNRLAYERICVTLIAQQADQDATPSAQQRAASYLLT